MVPENRPELRVVPGGRSDTGSGKTERPDAGGGRRPFRCHTGQGARPGSCRSDADCADDELCFDGRCV